ncbi:MAG: MepB family protein [Renibacterium salmoninarum]|nr:MepB family protein [Renibacterium salmoninarum]
MSGLLPRELSEVRAVLAGLPGLRIHSVVLAPESREYAACQFRVGSRSAQFRAAKNTPEKAGLFVALWQRSADGPIRPFDADDDAELFLIRARTGGPRGHFVFRKEVLIERGIVSQSGIGGKRGFRVYPPWCSGLNAQARRTQLWQSACFLFDDASPAQIEGHYAC